MELGWGSDWDWDWGCGSGSGKGMGMEIQGLRHQFVQFFIHTLGEPGEYSVSEGTKSDTHFTIVFGPPP